LVSALQRVPQLAEGFKCIERLAGLQRRGALQGIISNYTDSKVNSLYVCKYFMEVCAN